MPKLLLFLFLLFLSCKDNKQILPASTGSLEDIVVVIPDKIWKKYPDIIADSIFKQEYPGLQQPEPFFNIIKIRSIDFSRIFKTHKNIILFSDQQEDSIIINLWAYPQIVINIGLKNVKSQYKLIKAFEKYREIIYNRQLDKLKLNLPNSHISIKNNYGINVNIPNDYITITDNKELFWASHNPPNKDLIKQILVFRLKNIDEYNFNEFLINKVDSVLRNTLFGNKKNNYVQIEKRFPIDINKYKYRGLWRMSKDFMGGPLLIKAYREKDEVVISLGIIFAPGKQKKKYIIELDAIL
tara:strand:+ start:2060 stop:2950 length:891 start_codon:yes stop_codon:yes gene_type:complete